MLTFRPSSLEPMRIDVFHEALDFALREQSVRLQELGTDVRTSNSGWHP